MCPETYRAPLQSLRDAVTEGLRKILIVALGDGAAGRLSIKSYKLDNGATTFEYRVLFTCKGPHEIRAYT